MEKDRRDSSKRGKSESKLLDFDPGKLPYDTQNMQAAEQRGWKFDNTILKYMDVHSREIVADRFGQPL